MKLKGIKFDFLTKQQIEIEEEISDEEYQNQLEKIQKIQQEMELRQKIEKEKQKILEEQAIQRLKEKGIIE